MFVRPDPPEELESQQAHIVALQSDLSKQFLIAEQQIKEIDGLKGELSRAKRYSAALAQRVKALKEYNGKLRKANREMSDIISWLDNQCEDARQRVKALEGRNDGDEKDESTCTARS